MYRIPGVVSLMEKNKKKATLSSEDVIAIGSQLWKHKDSKFSGLFCCFVVFVFSWLLFVLVDSVVHTLNSQNKKNLKDIVLIKATKPKHVPIDESYIDDPYFSFDKNCILDVECPNTTSVQNKSTQPDQKISISSGKQKTNKTKTKITKLQILSSQEQFGFF